MVNENRKHVEQQEESLPKWRVEFNHEVDKKNNPELNNLIKRLEFFNSSSYSTKEEKEKAIEELEEEVVELTTKLALNDTIVAGLNRLLDIQKKRAERSLSDRFGLLVRFYRKQKGMNLQELSKRAGVSQSYINRIEKGERKTPSLSVIKSIADALEIDIRELIGHEIENGEKTQKNPLSLEEILLTSEYTVNGHKVSKEIRKSLIDIVKYIHENDWSTPKKADHFLKLSDKIEAYKELID